MFNINRKHLTRILVVALTVALAACSGESEDSSTAEDLAQAIDFTPIVSATGEVVPAQWATISSPASGFVSELLVAKGDSVEAGQVLAHVGNEQALQAAVAAASLELVAAQQALDDIHAQAGMRAAQAQLELANARDALRDAEYAWSVRQEGNRASPETIRQAKAKLVLAEEKLKDAKENYDSVSGRASDDPVRAQALVNWVNAQQARDSALRNLNWYTGHPTEIQQGVLDAEVAAAQARVDEAELEWEKRKDGPAEDEVALAEARLTNAQAQLLAVEAALAELEIRAPFSGTLSDLYIRESEWVTMGSPLLLLADLHNLEVQTTDLNEIDVARIQVGGPTTITFDSLPDAAVTGTVVSIAPKADEGSGVNYTVVIELEGIPEQLRWAMTAFVDIEVEE
ncbi:MAG: HlyD family secretion protein [Anaerolineales bacterium]